MEKLFNTLLRQILPDNVECKHDAFYYAIRSNRMDVIKMLAEKPNISHNNYIAYFKGAISKCYSELKHKKVLLSDETEFYVENKLAELLFYSNNDAADQDYCECFMEKRINFIIDCIEDLKQYSNFQYRNCFMCILRFIAKSIFILKNIMKHSYAFVPWEEMEFCLCLFILVHTKPNENAVFYKAVLRPEVIVRHLTNFSVLLQDLNEEYCRRKIKIKNILNFNVIPDMSRDEVREFVVAKYPIMSDLYYDYEVTRDLYTLIQIDLNIKTARCINIKRITGKTAIIRAFYLVSQYLQTTLEKPNISDQIRDILLYSLSFKARGLAESGRLVAYSLDATSEDDHEAESLELIYYLRNELDNLQDIVTDIKMDIRVSILSKMLVKIMEEKDNKTEAAYLGEITKAMEYSPIAEVMTTDKQVTLESLIKKADKAISTKSESESEMFVKINNYVEVAQYPKQQRFHSQDSLLTKPTQNNILTLISTLGVNIMKSIISGNYDSTRIEKMAMHTLTSLRPKQCLSVQNIAIILINIFRVAAPKLVDELPNLDTLYGVILKVMYMAGLSISDYPWILDYNKKYCIKTVHKSDVECNIQDFPKKLNELKGILINSGYYYKNLTTIGSYGRNIESQYAVETVLMQLLQILDKNGKLEDNSLSVDGCCPVLTGKLLLKYLFEKNCLFNILAMNPHISIISCARRLVDGNVLLNEIKLGNLEIVEIETIVDLMEKEMEAASSHDKLIEALENGSMEELMSSLKDGADLETQTLRKETLLHLSCKQNNVDIVRFILNNIHNPALKDGKGQLPINVATREGRRDVVEFLLKEKKYDVDASDSSNQTPLHVAAHMGYTEVVELLLQSGANTNAIDNSGAKPINHAITYNHYRIVEILLEKESHPDVWRIHGGCSLLHNAMADSVSPDVAKLLITKGADVNSKTDFRVTPLHIACKSGNLELVRLLVDNGADLEAIDVCRNVPILFAARSGFEEIFQLLADHSANIMVSDDVMLLKPLHIASKGGNARMLKTILKIHSDVNEEAFDGMTALHFAAYNNNVEIIEMLINSGSKVNAVNINDFTSFHIAAEAGNIDVVRFFISKKVDVNQKGMMQKSALHLATAGGHTEIVKLLVDNGACVNAADSMKVTPLHEACSRDKKEIVTFLMEKGADVNLVTSNKMTPLHYAIRHGSVDCISLLLQDNNIDIECRNENGRTPLHYATLNGNPEIINMLLDKNASVTCKDKEEVTPLHLSVLCHQEDILNKYLDTSNAVNIRSTKYASLLCSAIEGNYEGMVKILLERGADINCCEGEPLMTAISHGFVNITKILLNHPNIIVQDSSNFPIGLLHAAVKKADCEVVQMLLDKGLNPDSVSNGYSCLYIATIGGNIDVVKVLLKNGANINIKTNSKGTALHAAIGTFNPALVEVLIEGGIDVNIENDSGATGLDIIVGLGSAALYDVYLKHDVVDVDHLFEKRRTMLHNACYMGNMELVRYLLLKGSDLNATDKHVMTPIHIAAKKGHKEIVQLLIEEGADLQETDFTKKSILHHAIVSEDSETIDYIIHEFVQGYDINVKDYMGWTPLHIAASLNQVDTVVNLLKNGAIYNITDDADMTPFDLASDSGAKSALIATDKIFKAIRKGKFIDLDPLIKEGAAVNAKNADHMSCLHYAVFEEHPYLLLSLLINDAHLLTVDSEGQTPVHYAAKYSHYKMLLKLFSYGAIYNTKDENGKTPVDISTNKEIIDFLVKVDKFFEKAKRGDESLVDDVKRFNEYYEMTALYNVHDDDGKCLMVYAIQNSFTRIEEMRKHFEKSICNDIDDAKKLIQTGKNHEALEIFQGLLEGRRELLSTNNPTTLFIQGMVSVVMHRSGDIEEALRTLEIVYVKQKLIYGDEHNVVLGTEGLYYMLLHKCCGNDEVLSKLQSVIQRQEIGRGETASRLDSTTPYLAMVYSEMGMYEESIIVWQGIYRANVEVHGERHQSTLEAISKVALNLLYLGKCEESLNLYMKVLESRRKVLGLHHEDTAQSYYNIAFVYLKEDKRNRGIEYLLKAYTIQKTVLGLRNENTLSTIRHLANQFYLEGKLVIALKYYKECLLYKQTMPGDQKSHCEELTKKINTVLGTFKSTNQMYLLNDIEINMCKFAEKGEMRPLMQYLSNGMEPNCYNSDGWSPLHCAVHEEHLNVVSALLENGADVKMPTMKGDTVLHLACSTGNLKIIELLIRTLKKHNNKSDISKILNTKNDKYSSTALHVAAKNGYTSVVKHLLKNGVIYNVTDKHGRTPASYVKEQDLKKVFELVDDLFNCAAKDNNSIVEKLSKLSREDQDFAFNAHNTNEQTAIQVAIVNKNKKIAGALLKVMQDSK